MKTMDIAEVKMIPKLGKILWSLVSLTFLHTSVGGSSMENNYFKTRCPKGFGGTSDILLTQTPSSWNVTEGSTLTMECRIERNLSDLWFWEWFHNKSDGSVYFDRKSQEPHKILVNGSSTRIILTRTKMDDSGSYFCYVADYENHCIQSNGTKVTITELSDLQVSQTLGPLEVAEGSSVTLECRFKTVSNLSTMSVRWRKGDLEGDLGNKTASLTIIQRLQDGFSSLTLMEAHVNTSGSYVCEVGSSLRNLSGSGKPTQIVVIERRQWTEGRPEGGLGIGALAGIVAGAFLLLVLLSLLMWKLKRRHNGTQVSMSEAEAVPINDPKLHPPLTGQASDVMYADLHFHKQESDSEVVYAEVKTKSKLQENKNNQIKPGAGRRIH